MKTKRKIKLNLWQQIAIAGIALFLFIIVASWLGLYVVAAASDSQWLAIVLFGYFAIGGLIPAGIAYGVWRLGDHD